MRRDRALGFRILGPLEAELDGRPLQLRPQHKLVLTSLLVPLLDDSSGNPVSAEQLGRRVWQPGHPRSTASIRVTIQDLRDRLDPDRGDGQETVIPLRGYRLIVPRWTIDAWCFRMLYGEGRQALKDGDLDLAENRLTRALGLWRGFPFADPEPWDDDAIRLREKLELECRSAREMLAEVRSRAGWDRVDELAQLLSEDENHERVRGWYALALYRAGNRTQAIAVLGKGIQLLGRQRLDPSALLELRHRMRADDPGLAAPDRPRFQLPAPPTAPPQPFCGRAAELATVTSCLLDGWDDRRAAPRCQITGPAEVGKTAIALMAADRLKDWFPDGVVLVSLHGNRENQKPGTEVIADVLRTLGLPVTGSRSNRAKRLSHATAGRRMLVIADGAAEEEQVRGLLEDCGCAVLVTSRDALAVDGMTTIPVRPFTPAAAAEYLAARLTAAGRPGETEDDLSRAVDVLHLTPAALNSGAADIVRDPDVTLAEWTVRRKRQLPSGVRPGLQKSLLANYWDLDETTQRTFRLLGLVDARLVSGWTAASLLDCGLDDAEQALDLLAGARLLQASVSRGRKQYYLRATFHTLAKDLVADEPLAAAAQERCLRAHYWLARQARAVLDPDAEPPPEQPGWASSRQGPVDLVGDPIAWFNDEHGAMVSAVRLAHRTGHWSLTWRLTRELVPFFDIAERGEAWEETHRLALDAAHHSDETAGQAWTLCGLGLLKRYQGMTEEAADSFTEAQRLFTGGLDVPDRFGQATAHYGHGDILIGMGQFDRAIAEFQTALEAFRSLGKLGGQATVMAGLGEAHAMRGIASRPVDREDLLKAVSWSEQSVQLATRLGDRRRRASALRDLGVAYRFLGSPEDLERASDAFTQCATEYKQQGDRFGQAQTMVSHGVLREQQGRSAEARQAYQDAAFIFESLHDYRWVGNAYRQLAESWFSEGIADEAITAYDRAIASLRTTEYRRELAVCLIRRGHAHQLAGAPSEAAADWQEARAIASEIGDPELAAEASALPRAKEQP